MNGTSALKVIVIVLNVVCMVLYARQGNILLTVCWSIVAILNTISYILYDKSQKYKNKNDE